MLTARENLIELLEHRTPDRIVNQFEAIPFVINPFLMKCEYPEKGAKEPVADLWGVYYAFPDNVPASFPLQDEKHLLVKDIEHWSDYVKAPSLKFTDEEWGIAKEMYDAVDRKKAMPAMFMAPGLFEQCHDMCTIEETLMGMYECPDEMHDMIKMLTDFELELAEQFCSRIHPEAVFHHDDWGSQRSTFMSVPMFEDFFVEPYQQIYGYLHDHGVKYIFHHSDSYAATLVPDMIEMGIDVWQGCFSTNNLPELIQKYGDKITFMGGIENCLVDFDGWTPENNREVIRRTVKECGTRSFIPCIAQGAPGSVFEGVYMSMTDEIDALNMELYGFTKKELEDSRVPIVLFD